MMIKKGKQLNFISFIKRDGTGTIMIGTPWTAESDFPKVDNTNHLHNEEFSLSRLSVSNNTWIAFGSNIYVVKIKPLYHEQN